MAEPKNLNFSDQKVVRMPSRFHRPCDGCGETIHIGDECFLTYANYGDGPLESVECPPCHGMANFIERKDEVCDKCFIVKATATGACGCEE